MISKLTDRLSRLEAQAMSTTAPQPSDPAAKLMQILVAYHVGEAGPRESIAEGLARALGYGHGPELRVALQSGSGVAAVEDFNVRWQGATTRLLALKGVSPDCNGPAFGAALQVLCTELPEHLQQHPFLSEAA